MERNSYAHLRTAVARLVLQLPADFGLEVVDGDEQWLIDEREALEAVAQAIGVAVDDFEAWQRIADSAVEDYVDASTP